MPHILHRPVIYINFSRHIRVRNTYHRLVIWTITCCLIQERNSANIIYVRSIYAYMNILIYCVQAISTIIGCLYDVVKMSPTTCKCFPWLSKPINCELCFISCKHRFMKSYANFKLHFVYYHALVTSAHRGWTLIIVLGLVCLSIHLSTHLSVCHTFSGVGHNSKSNQWIVFIFGAISSQVGWIHDYLIMAIYPFSFSSNHCLAVYNV